jgi:molybdate transport system permease protein
MNGVGPALWMSVKVALAATIVVGLIGVPLAFYFAKKTFRGKSIIEALLTIPLVLPPTVVGYLIIVSTGARSPIGAWVRTHFGYTLLFTTEGAILAAAVVSFPLLYLPAKSAFAAIDAEMQDMARLLGASPREMFWHVSLPLARKGVASGLMLAFARALGEFGATVMVLGDIEGRRTLPIQVYSDYVAGDFGHAFPAVALLVAISLVVIVAYNRFGLRG